MTQSRGPADDPKWPGGYVDPRDLDPSKRAMLLALERAGAILPPQGKRGPVDDYEIPPDDWTRDDASGQAGNNETSYGRVVRLPCVAGVSQKVNGLWTPDEPFEVPWTATLQVTSGPIAAVAGDGTNTAGTVTATVQWMVGGATFKKDVELRGTVALQFPVVARRVMIDVQVTASAAGTPYVDVAIGAARGALLSSPQRFVPSWQYTEQLASIACELEAGPGILLSAIAVVGGVPGAGPYYPMFFDLAAGLGLPGALAGLLPILVATPVTGSGQLVSLSDEFAADITFQKSLYFAWSAHAAHFVAPGGPFLYSLNCKLGT